MDPFSIAVGAVALTETATKIAGTLLDRYQSFASAPRAMVEIADEITMCAAHVDIFARSVDTFGHSPKGLQKDTEKLVAQCHAIIETIRQIIPKGSNKAGYTDRLRYAFGQSKKLQDLQGKLKEIQRKIIFMMTSYQLEFFRRTIDNGQPLDRSGQMGTTAAPYMAGNPPIGNLQGVLTHIPVEINLGGNGYGVMPVTYEATISLKPTARRPSLSSYPSVTSSNSRPLLEKLKKERSKIGRDRTTADQAKLRLLENMKRTSSPPLDTTMPIEALLADEPEEHPAEEARIRRLEKEELNVKARIEKLRRGSRFRDNEEETRLRRRLEQIQRERVELDHQKRERLIDARVRAKRLMEERLKDNGENNARLRVTSREEARDEVTNLLKRWFDDDETVASGPREDQDTSEDEQTLAEDHTNLNTPDLSGDHFDGHQAQSSSEEPEWDWACDGCHKIFRTSNVTRGNERKYECGVCDNFDFCKTCYHFEEHRHPKRYFTEKFGGLLVSED